MKKKPVKKKAQKKKKPGSKSPRSTKKGESSLSKKSNAQQEKLEIVLALSLHTASLALAKDEYVELAAISGTCGPFRLSGNSLPCIEYRVFEQKLMEFIKIRVEISKPDTIRFIGTIDCKGSKGEHTEAARHGEEVPVLEKYKEPFQKLSAHLMNYFPYTPNPEGWGRDENRKDIPKKMAS